MRIVGDEGVLLLNRLDDRMPGAFHAQIETFGHMRLDVPAFRRRRAEQTVAADFVCIAGGLYPLAELAAIIGCPFRSLEELGGHVPVHNERMETPIAGLYVAGNITGIESAKVARAQGVVAGLSIAMRVRAAASGSVARVSGDISVALERELSDAIEQVKAVRRAATIQFHPHIERGRQAMEAVFREEVQGVSSSG
jgi:sarcosine oxidase subunit alpha